MIEFSVRDARYEEAGTVAEMVRQMIVDMVRYGGRAAATDDTAWNNVAGDIAEELKGNNSKFLIAETAISGTADCLRIGLAAASISTLGGAFAPKKIVHLRFVYVAPSFRGAGVGSKLISEASDWGRRMGGDCCNLNVLLGNPVISLYRKLGFAEVAVNMTKPLKIP